MKKNRTSSSSFRKLYFIGIVAILLIASSTVLYIYRYDVLRYIKREMLRLDVFSHSEDLNIHDYRNTNILNHHLDYVFGIDISHYQEKVIWKDINWIYNEYPLKFVILRSTMGWNGKDAHFENRWSELRNSRFVRGAYHFYRPDEPSTEQAYNFIETVRLIPGDFPPILDIETLPKIQSMARLKVGLKNWLDIVEARYGVRPIIYSGQHYYETYLKNDFKDYPVWIANYNHSVKKIPSYSMMWQFTEKGVVKGVSGRVDVNVFNGAWSDLEKWRVKAVKQ